MGKGLCISLSELFMDMTKLYCRSCCLYMGVVLKLRTHRPTRLPSSKWRRASKPSCVRRKSPLFRPAFCASIDRQVWGGLKADRKWRQACLEMVQGTYAGNGGGPLGTRQHHGWWSALSTSGLSISRSNVSISSRLKIWHGAR